MDGKVITLDTITVQVTMEYESDKDGWLVAKNGEGEIMFKSPSAHEFAAQSRLKVIDDLEKAISLIGG